MSGERRTEYIPLSEIKRARRNPKQHDDAQIEASLQRFGMAELVLLDERTGLLVAGEGRVNALTALKERDPRTPPSGITLHPTGEWMIPVTMGWSSTDDKEADAYLIASNRLSERGGWDGLGLAEMMSSLQGELDGIGYDDHELDALMRETGFLAAQATKHLDELPVPDLGPAPSPVFSGGNENPFTEPPPPAPVLPAANPFAANGSAPVQPLPQTAPSHSPAIPPNTTQAAGATEPQWFQLTWSATHEQRETIHNAIRAVREKFPEVTTAVAALAAACQFFLDYAESEAQ